MNALIAGAAAAGLLFGKLAVRTYAAKVKTKAGVSLQTVADDAKGKHGGKCKNSCKGNGGCANHGSKPQV